MINGRIFLGEAVDLGESRSIHLRRTTYEIHVAHLQRREGLGWIHRSSTAGFHGRIHEIHPTNPVGGAVVVPLSVAAYRSSHQRPPARPQRPPHRRPTPPN